MIEIIPAIIAKSFEEIHEKIKKVEGLVDWVQLDIMDGKLVPNTTWNNPGELKVENQSASWRTKVNLEAHLMIEKPWEHIDDWIASGVKRIIIHFESFRDNFNKIEAVIKKIKDNNLEVALAVNPSTPLDAVKYLANKVDIIFVMAVEPGFGGQMFKDDILHKISDLRKRYPDNSIEVDGGIIVGTARLVAAAGANILVSGSFIYKHPEGAGRAISELRKDAEMDVEK